MKTAALDMGDVWTGIALSDPLGIIASPYTTVQTVELHTFLSTFITKEHVSDIVVGLPKTMKGTDSEQTDKVKKQFEQLKTEFKDVSWHLWDERLSSKRAETLKRPQNKDDKKKTHAVAAAFILTAYLSAHTQSIS